MGEIVYVTEEEIVDETPGRDGVYHGKCGWNGCREDYKGNPSESMINNCKWDRDDKEYWLEKIN